MTIINDPATSIGARVNDDQFLLTSSITNRLEGYAAHLGQSFILHAKCHLAAAALGGLMYFQNLDPIYEVIFTRLFFDAHMLTTPILIKQIKQPATITDGTDISDTGIINKNYTSALSVTSMLKISDGSSDMTYTGGTDYHNFSLASSENKLRDMHGTTILGKTDKILWAWETEDGSNAVDGETVGLSMNFYIKTEKQFY